MNYGKRPTDLGKILLPEYYGTYLLYLPIKLKDRPGVRIPIPGIMPLYDIIHNDFGNIDDKYVYLSYECSYVQSGITQKRPGWHSDGFRTSDINYIWYSNTPTVFNNTDFKVSDDHNISMGEFESQADYRKNFTMPTRHLLKMDQYVIHKADIPKDNDIRTFIKVSISDDKYNLKGNTHNPMFNYKWTMYDRALVRNHPQIKEVDSVPEGIKL